MKGLLFEWWATKQEMVNYLSAMWSVSFLLRRGQAKDWVWPAQRCEEPTGTQNIHLCTLKRFNKARHAVTDESGHRIDSCESSAGISEGCMSTAATFRSLHVFGFQHSQRVRCAMSYQIYLQGKHIRPGEWALPKKTTWFHWASWQMRQVPTLLRLRLSVHPPAQRSAFSQDTRRAFIVPTPTQTICSY